MNTKPRNSATIVPEINKWLLSVSNLPTLSKLLAPEYQSRNQLFLSSATILAGTPNASLAVGISLVTTDPAPVAA